MVEQVKRLRDEIDLVALLETELLGQPQVDVLECRQLKSVARLKGHSERTAASIGPVARSAGDFEPISELDGGACWQASVDALGDSEAVLNRNDRSDLPTGDHVPYERALVFTPEWYFPYSACDEAARNIEVGPGVLVLEIVLVQGCGEARRERNRSLVQIG